MSPVLKKEKPKKKKKVNPKPYPANQFTYDPRQDPCWDYFIDPTSETFGNAYQSALKAKFSKGHAAQITLNEWWIEKARRIKLLSKAEKVLEKTIDMETNTPVIGAYGAVMVETGEFDEKGKAIKVVLYGENDRLLKIQQDSAKFVAERLGKKKGYSTRQELTGKDGETLLAPIINIVQYAEPRPE